MSGNQTRLATHFASDLYLEGNIAIPVMLLKYYKRLNINEMELVLMLHLISKRQFDNNSFPSSEELANYMTIDPLTIKSTIASLIEKGVLMVERKYDLQTGDWVNYYSMEKLFLKLADLWALEHLNDKEAKENSEKLEKEVLSQLYKTFEREFGRLLSPMEISQIAEWYKGDKYSPELIYEALKRAVLRNVFNFKYIDSILRDWSRNNITTVRQAQLQDEKFQVNNKLPRKAVKEKMTGKNAANQEKERDKYRDLYLS